MFHFHDYFHRMHADPKSWIDLFAVLEKARSELPKTSFQPTILCGENETLEQAVSHSLRRVFEPVSMEVAGAAGDRFQDGHWPERLSEEAAYFLRVILTFAMQTVAHFAPTPDRQLKPTIIPFPKASVADVALWFATEWWTVTGGPLYEMEICKNQDG